MITPPDETFSTAEAAEVLRKSERQVLRYLTAGQLRGSQASGRWTVTALQIWHFQGIAAEMMDNWRSYCRLHEADSPSDAAEQIPPQNQPPADSGE